MWYTCRLLDTSTSTVHYGLKWSGPLSHGPGASRGWREDDDPAQSPSEFPGAHVAYLLPSSTIHNSVKKSDLFQHMMWLDYLSKMLVSAILHHPVTHSSSPTSTAPKEGRVSEPRETCDWYDRFESDFGSPHGESYSTNIERWCLETPEWDIVRRRSSALLRWLFEVALWTLMQIDSTISWKGNRDAIFGTFQGFDASTCQKFSCTKSQPWIASVLKCTERASSNGSSSFRQLVNGIQTCAVAARLSMLSTVQH